MGFKARAKNNDDEGNVGSRKITNAKIDETMLGIEDHGITTAILHLEWEGSAQGFGAYILGNSETPSAGLGLFVRRVLEVVGVRQWEHLKGKYVRIDHEWHRIHRIGHIVEDRWFDPAVELEKLK